MPRRPRSRYAPLRLRTSQRRRADARVQTCPARFERTLDYLRDVRLDVDAFERPDGGFERAVGDLRCEVSVTAIDASLGPGDLGLSGGTGGAPRHVPD